VIQLPHSLGQEQNDIAGIDLQRFLLIGLAMQNVALGQAAIRAVKQSDGSFDPVAFPSALASDRD
jgi:hypothetical protein